MSMPQHIIDLFINLEEGTKAGKIEWQEGAAAFEFVVAVAGYSVVIAKDRQGDISLVVMNDVGRIVDRYEFEFMERDQAHDLYEAAKHQAMRVDDVFSEINRKLRGEDTGGS